LVALSLTATQLYQGKVSTTFSSSTFSLDARNVQFF